MEKCFLMHQVSFFALSPNSHLRFTWTLSHANFYLPFLVIAPNGVALENSSLFVWASFSRTMKQAVSAVSRFSSKMAWPGMLTGFGSSHVDHTLTKDAQPGLLSESLQTLFSSLLKQSSRIMERCDDPALDHITHELGYNAQWNL